MSSVKRAVAVMDLLAREDMLGVRAIAQKLDLPLGSIHRIMQDLADVGVVARSSEGQWELSYRLLGIVGPHLDRLEFPRIARPFCERMAREFQESVSVSGLSGLYGICLDKVRGNVGMQLDASVGFHGPLTCGGGGKAMLAWISEADRKKVIEAPLEGPTPLSITDRVELLAELQRIRERGYAIDWEEVVLGVHCVGMPIFDRTGYAIGAISISGTQPKDPGERLDQMVAMLSEACEHTSRRMGFGGAWPPVEMSDGMGQAKAVGA